MSTANKGRAGRQRVRNKKDLQAASYEITVADVIRELLNLLKKLGVHDLHTIKQAKMLIPPVTSLSRPIPHAEAIGDLLTVWHQDPRYLNQSGNPMPVKMDGPCPSFRELAERSVPSISAKQLLHKLERLGVLRINKHGFVHARARSLPVYQDKRLAAVHTLSALRGFIRTLSHNLDSGPSNADQLFHRIAWNGDLNKQDVPRLKIWLKRHGQNLLESADNWMIAGSKSRLKSSRRSKHTIQVSIGIYLAVDDP